MTRPVAGRGQGRGGGYGPRGIGRPVEKAKDFKGTVRRLLRYMRPHRLSLAVVFLLTILSTLFGILSPKIMGQATTILFQGMVGRMQGVAGAGIDYGAIKQILFVLGGVYVASTIFSYLQQLVMVNVSQKTVYRMREEI